MTFDDDYIQFMIDGYIHRWTCRQMGLDWPPPERFEFMGTTLQRISISKLTDEQRVAMAHGCRGAAYKETT